MQDVDNDGATWKILSLLLMYPADPEFHNVLEDAADWATDLGDVTLARLVRDFLQIDTSGLAEEYCRYFDFQSRTSLHLTAHELGDDRKRGVALLALRRMLTTTGFVQQTSELPDYLPLLFEFLAAKPEGIPTEDLELRLARVCRVILNELPRESVYHGVFQMAVDILPNATVPSGSTIFTGFDKANIDDAPYPVFYD